MMCIKVTRRRALIEDQPIQEKKLNLISKKFGKRC